MKTILNFLLVCIFIINFSSFTEKSMQEIVVPEQNEIELTKGKKILILKNLNSFYENKAKVVKVSSAKIKVDIKTCGKSDVDDNVKYISMNPKLKRAIASCGTAYVLEQNGKTYYIHSTKEFNCDEQQNVVLKVKILKILELSTGEYYNLMVIDK